MKNAESATQKQEDKIFEATIWREDDEESIEEFDPEDPDFQEQDEDENKDKTEKVSPAVYKYDMALKSYVRLEEGACEKTADAPQSGLSLTEGEEDQKEAKQPNILKKRLLMPMTMTNLIKEAGSSKGEPTPKMQKLDFNNPLSVKNAPEDGIMYVTVKGAKPNEILLVKVRNKSNVFREKWNILYKMM